MGDFLESHPQKLGLAIAENVAEFLVDSKPASVGAHVRDSERRKLKRRPIKFLAVAKCLLQSGAALQHLLNIQRIAQFGDGGIEEAFVTRKFFQGLRKILPHRRLDEI